MEPRPPPGLRGMSAGRHSFSRYSPVPETVTFNGTLVALVTMLTFAVFLSAACGLNVTEMVHDAPAARLVGQFSVIANHVA